MSTIDKKSEDLMDIGLAYWLMKRDWRQIVKNLRERKAPLPVEYCRELGDLIDPDKLQPQGRPPLNKRMGEIAYNTKKWPGNITKMQFIRIDAFFRALIEDPEVDDIRDSFDAKEATCKALGLSGRTYDKIYKQVKGHCQYDIEKQLAKELTKKQSSD